MNIIYTLLNSTELYWGPSHSRARNAIQMSVVCSDTNLAIDKCDLERSCRTGPKKCLICSSLAHGGLIGRPPPRAAAPSDGWPPIHDSFWLNPTLVVWNSRGSNSSRIQPSWIVRSFAVSSTLTRGKHWRVAPARTAHIASCHGRIFRRNLTPWHWVFPSYWVLQDDFQAVWRRCCLPVLGANPTLVDRNHRESNETLMNPALMVWNPLSFQ